MMSKARVVETVLATIILLLIIGCGYWGIPPAQVLTDPIARRIYLAPKSFGQWYRSDAIDLVPQYFTTGELASVAVGRLTDRGYQRGAVIQAEAMGPGRTEVYSIGVPTWRLFCGSTYDVSLAIDPAGKLKSAIATVAVVCL